MFTNFFKCKKTTPTYIVAKTTKGTYGIYGEDGNLFREYTRRGDAIRGGTRAGITISA